MLSNLILIGMLVFLILFAVTMIMHIICMVPYVPTNMRTVDAMIKAAKLRKRDVVFDLGCGDARLLIESERRHGTQARGFEIAPLIYFLAIGRKFLFRSKVQIHFKNFFNDNLSEANVIFCYLIPKVMPNLAEKIKKECKKGTKIISNTFHIPGLKPHKVIKKNPLKRTPSIYIYHV
ncbi:hypothetical protein COV82_05170 [Candidatus Peregrinibacteria bacterium CG11_big_fil_rev_8_21_14_0_20_46_8]|nr:MAG: hypothetical protein COV82_05170 [Candidatus Peregrinibacteria bacterium CG11_big_fil_rev_8_21_14_0_20_46_8]